MKPGVQRTAYDFLALTLLALLIAIAAGLSAAAQPSNLRPVSLSSVPAELLASTMLLFAITGVGIFVRPPEMKPVLLPAWFVASWLLTLVLTTVTAILDSLRGDGTSSLVLLPVFAAITLVIYVVWHNIRQFTPFTTVWAIGVLLGALGLLLVLIPWPNASELKVLRATADGLMLFVGLPLASVAVAFWLTLQFAELPVVWVNTGVKSAAAFYAASGVAQIFQRIAPDAFSACAAMASIVLISLATTIFASHLYAAFSARRLDQTLSAHWVALGVLLWLFAGALGAVLAVPLYASVATDTQVTTAQALFVTFGAVAIILGSVNHNSALIRQVKTRTTGLLSFWLTATGMLGSALILTGIGTAQAVIHQIGGVDQERLGVAFMPLYSLWLLSLLIMATGFAIYALTFWLRRPSATDDSLTGQSP